MPVLALLALSALTQESNDFSKVWDDVSESISTRYYARESRGREMRKRLEHYAPLARAATSRAQFDAILDRMIGEFRDSHFDFFTEDEQGFYAMDGLIKKEAIPMPHIGAWFRKGSDGYTVTMVLNGSEAERAGLRKGDLVLGLASGQSFSPVASFRDGGRVRLRVRRSLALSDSFLNPPREFQPELSVKRDPPFDMFLSATRASTRVIERDGKRIGYFRLWTQSNQRFLDAMHDALKGPLKNTDALILDLRDGFGGRPYGFAEPFLRRSERRPLAVLINGGTRSAKEVLAHEFKKKGRGTLIGSTTAGHVLGTWPIRIADWAYLEIPMTEVKLDGVRLEGRGVDPDVEVPRESDASGRDLILEAAMVHLEGK